MSSRSGIPYGRQSIGQDDVAAVDEVLRSPFLTTGPKVDTFESDLARTLDAPHAIAVSNGTAALHLIYAALGVSKESTVVVPTNTFVASASAASLLGARILLADVDPDTGLLTPDSLEATLRSESEVGVTVCVHYAGQSCDMVGIDAVTRRYGGKVVEDSCHAIGATQHIGEGRLAPVGSCLLSAASAFSFHPVKTITTAEGGAVSTRDPDLAERVRLLRSHGLTKSQGVYDRPTDHRGRVEPWHYRLTEPGFNYRLSDVQAALGISQLGKLESFISRRNELVSRYQSAIVHKMNGIRPIASAGSGEPAWHLFPILCENREMRSDLYHFLHDRDIAAQVHYVPLYDHPYFANQIRRIRGLGPNVTMESIYPGGARFYERQLSLPLYPDLTDEEQGRVIDALHEFLC